MGRLSFHKAFAESAEELATSQGKNTLVFYLVSRFVAVMIAVIIVEAGIVWLESVTLLPIVQAVISNESQDSFKIFLAAALVVLMVILLVAPLLIGAVAFATAVERKVRALHERRERELVQIAQQRSQFITDIAHDLRTPLMAISGMSHALEDGIVPSDAQRDEYLHSICEKSDKMGVLVNAVFDYSKLDGGSFELKRQVIDLSQLLLTEAALAYTDAEDAGMQLTTCIPEERCAIDADPVQIARVVSNLVSNAIRHNEAGTEVSVLLVRQTGTAYAIVADTGSAIPGNPEDLFRPFVQGDTARSSARGGSGLGLSICKRIADMHGFSLSVAQPYGRFSKAFVLQCPECE